MSFLVRRANKYGAKKVTFKGRWYHSKGEAGYAQYLEIAKKATRKEERVVKYQGQYIVDIYLDGARLTLEPTMHKLFRIIPDFLVTFADKHQEVHEYKGFETAEWRFKWRILEAVMNVERPEIGLVVIKH